MASKDHFCALGRQTVDKERTDIGSGGSKAVVERYLIEPLFQRHLRTAENTAIEGSNLEPGPLRKDVSPRGDRDQGRFVERVGTVRHQPDAIIAGIRGHRLGRVGRQVERE